MHQVSFNQPLSLLVCRPGRRLDDHALMTLLLDLYDDPEFRPGMDELWCFLDTREAGVTGAGLRQIARTFPRRTDVGARPNFVAIVTRSQLGLGLSRLYGAYAERCGQVTLEVFEDVGRAADWLDEMRNRPAGATADVAARLLSEQAAAPAASDSPPGWRS